MIKKFATFMKVKPQVRMFLVNEVVKGGMSVILNSGSSHYIDKHTAIAWQPDDQQCLNLAMGWFHYACLQTAGQGVPALYSLTSGYTAAYPETTGYIIPTLFHYGQVCEQVSFRELALANANWLCEIQNDDGSIQAGHLGMNLPGCVFNTGMVLFGWLAAYKETQDQKFLTSAIKAAKWLEGCLDDSGCFVKNLSHYAENAPFHTYNVRVAWALTSLAKAIDDQKLTEKMAGQLEWTLNQANAQGFFSGAEMAGYRWPLTHTIAYTLRGVLETGLLLEDQKALKVVQLAMQGLIKQQSEAGSFPGIYDDKWCPRVSWDCLTGTAQLGIICYKLWQQTGDQQYQVAFLRALEWLKQRQCRASHMQEINGGIFGSFPIYGGYHAYSIPNWAVKFYADLLLLKREYYAVK